MNLHKQPAAAVKICGLQDVEVLKSMVNLPVDYIGVVFAKSRRRIEPKRAAELKEVLLAWTTLDRPKLTGVFVNPTLEELEHVMDAVQLDVIQLHGQETPAFCEQVKQRWQTEVFKAFSFPKSESGTEADDTTLKILDSYVHTIDAILLDTYDPQYVGGSGHTFAWERIPTYAKWARNHGIVLFVAGGLQPDNIQQLIQTYAPNGVDVSSGVETDGIKDIAKITAFVERVKQA
ncbi:N-(5'-phosphoribosyl)anthranilate isomerase [Paenibacillus sp. Root52]|uniref:phosphoribosylanthranilate isomerase n=1 Tax=Paenibacillus sp. Root52 TaxID=1736552 RepID=UPI0006F8DEC9|nr:phosphoribosylanthranilate isomerase [Paenibacillus sp. Root52]KQY87768.1 N-(5'-phosphoribosyl)anthranilate isomerase [Paenibacillus sp. Root52]